MTEFQETASTNLNSHAYKVLKATFSVSIVTTTTPILRIQIALSFIYVQMMFVLLFFIGAPTLLFGKRDV